MLAHDEKSIIALCTPQGSGALALMRIVGLDAFEKIDKIAFLSSKKLLSTVDSHTVHHGYIRHPITNKLIDEVMFILMRGPRTFTGQDTIEITLHNNPYLISAFFDAVLEIGIVRAQAGAFSKRAFLNGKIDLLQAEAIHEIITAAHESQVHAAMLQLQGSFSSVIQEIEADLFTILVHVEASFEFLDEEQRDLDFQGKIIHLLSNLLNKIKEILEKNRGEQRVKEGVRIALIGSVNAGKSTLFNALVGKNRAIVSPLEGTTRDTIESSLFNNGFFRTYVDTAGLRKTDNLIEREGIERTENESKNADLLLLVIDGSISLSLDQQRLYQDLLHRYHDKIIIICSKADKETFTIPSWITERKEEMIALSAQDPSSIKECITLLDKRISALVGDRKAVYLLNDRQAAHLDVVQRNCIQGLYATHGVFQAEIIAHHIHQALEQLIQLTGKNVTEKCHDEIFRNFCVGK